MRAESWWYAAWANVSRRGGVLVTAWPSHFGRGECGRAAPCTCRGQSNGNSNSGLSVGWRGGSDGRGRREPPGRPSRWRLGVRALAKQCFASKARSEEHTSELQSQSNIVCRVLLEKKVAKERTSTGSRVFAAGCVVIEGIKTIGR